jgi:hypothetical protein
MKKAIIFKLFRSVIEIKIHQENYRNTNIQHIFDTSIYWMPDVCDVYDECFERLKRESKWNYSTWKLHERTYKLTKTLLAIMYDKENKLNINKK